MHWQLQGGRFWTTDGGRLTRRKDERILSNMDIQSTFYPPRRTGMIFHITAGVILLGAAALVFLQVYQREVGQDFIIGILLSAALAAPLPLLVYRGYALTQASYTLDRDGLRLRWGLRGEDIPLPQIEWVRPANEMGFRLPLPFLQWPGAVLGQRKVEGLGEVEFLASDIRNLLLVATPEKIYAISPADGRAFIRSFRLIIELGSLSPIPSYSVLPAAFLERVWSDRLARWTVLAGLGLTLACFLLAALLIPARQTVSLGYDAARQPMDPVSPEHILLLPVLGSVIYVIDLLAGLFFYRRDGQRLVAYLLWGSSVLTPVLLLLAMALM